MRSDFFGTPCPCLEDYQDPTVSAELFRCRLSNKIMTKDELGACLCGAIPEAIQCETFAKDRLEKHKDDPPREIYTIY